MAVADRAEDNANSNALLWLLGAIFSVLLFVSLVAEGEPNRPVCISATEAREAGVLTYASADLPDLDCGY